MAGIGEEDVAKILSALSGINMPIATELVSFPVEWLNTHPIGRLSQIECVGVLLSIRNLGYQNYTGYDFIAHPSDRFGTAVWKKYVSGEFRYEDLRHEMQPVLVESLSCAEYDASNNRIIRRVKVAPLYDVVVKHALKACYDENDLCMLAYGFCRGGYVNATVPSLLVAMLMNQVKYRIDKFSPDFIVRLAWTLCVTQDMEKPNPFGALVTAAIPRAQPTRYLTFDDLVDLHQTAGYAKIMVERKVWPPGVLADFREESLARARQIYKQYDVCHAPELRDLILSQLKERGIEAKKDGWLKDTWRVDILEKNAAIMIFRKTWRNEKGKMKGREYMKEKGAELSVKKLIKVDADKWDTLDDEGRQNEIEDIIKAIVQSSVRQ